MLIMTITICWSSVGDDDADADGDNDDHDDDDDDGDLLVKCWCTSAECNE